MNPFDSKANRQRWALVRECIDSGVWDDKAAYRKWLWVEFGTSSTKEMSAGQLRVLWTYLMHFAGKLPAEKMRLNIVMPWHANRRQLHRIEQLQQELGWDPDALNQFITRQLGVSSFPRALSKQAATKVMIGLERVIIHQKNKANGSLTL